eukprot:gene20360-28828_t
MLRGDALARYVSQQVGGRRIESLGLPLGAMRAALVVVLALATGAAVAQTGLIAFVGLASPHLVRSIVKTTHARLIVLSTLMGGLLLMAADLLARWLIAPQELPVGVLTAVIGGSYLLWLMHRRSARARSVSATLGVTEVLHGIDLRLSSARWTSIVGPNGAGKSTLLKALAGLLAHRGEVRLFGEAQGKIPARVRAQRLSWLGQSGSGEGSADDLMVYDIAMLGRLPHQRWLAAPSPADRE